MKEKLYDSEAKVMEIIWANSPISAKEISLIAAETIGWNKNTTYTVIKRLEAKGFIQREDPGFICTPLVPQNQMHIRRADNLWRVLAFLIVSTHWFNPLSWVFLRLFLTDLELSCDECVLHY